MLKFKSKKFFAGVQPQHEIDGIEKPPYVVIEEPKILEDGKIVQHRAVLHYTGLTNRIIQNTEAIIKPRHGIFNRVAGFFDRRHREADLREVFLPAEKALRGPHIRFEAAHRQPTEQ
jgi:hypothetical protein